MKKLTKKSTTKPKDRVFDKYKRNSRWVMLLEYREGLTNRRYQKMMFKTEKGGIKTAVKEAEAFAATLSRSMSISLKEMEEAVLCRVVAVYAEAVFESWQKEVGVDTAKTHIKDIVKMTKEDSPRDIKKVKKIGVR